MSFGEITYDGSFLARMRAGLPAQAKVTAAADPTMIDPAKLQLFDPVKAAVDKANAEADAADAAAGHKSQALAQVGKSYTWVYYAAGGAVALTLLAVVISMRKG